MHAFFARTNEHRALLVPLVFGFVALYLLLPRERPVLRWLGILIGLVGLGGLGFTLLPPGLTLHGVLFYLFSGVAIAAAGSTITHHNPIYSALSFALVTLSVCGLFLLRGAQFLAAATIIIYAGAIVVTFLFIIMLARQSGNAPYDRRAREPFLSTLAAFLRPWCRRDAWRWRKRPTWEGAA
jgi:NADH-quinone oxidoreductase subunit J